MAGKANVMSPTILRGASVKSLEVGACSEGVSPGHWGSPMAMLPCWQPTRGWSWHCWVTYVCPVAPCSCQQGWAWPWSWPAAAWSLWQVGGPQGRGPVGTTHAWPWPEGLMAWQGGGVRIRDYSGWTCPRERPSWLCHPILACHSPSSALAPSHSAAGVLVVLGEPPELVLKPSLKQGVCGLQVGGQRWQKWASLWPASPKGSSECWLQAGGQHAPCTQRTEGLPRQAHQVPGSSTAPECS